MNPTLTEGHGDVIKAIFVYPRTEQVEEVTLNTAQVTALLNSTQVWIESFSANLKMHNTVWSYGNGNFTLQIYLK
ncbi:hypothetical protein AB685_17840 [Bacillus sp. LL01]|uniref:hypothetical protein n=1 Tax=Bacillus sp. LL01 TaxID=1665556 RepID=UPI00064D342F|nr:hypothetical protein [Bacillus sp. LL01]KMJ57262.1 hypothetical protein AB685_17840 [Bacillus sp. LL01]